MAALWTCGLSPVGACCWLLGARCWLGHEVYQGPVARYHGDAYTGAISIDWRSTASGNGLWARRGRCSSMNDMDLAAPLSRAESNPTTSSCCAHQSHAGGVSVTQHKVPHPADSCRRTEPGWWLEMVRRCTTRLFQHPGAGAVLRCRGIEAASAATALFRKEKQAFVRWDKNSS
jgi:hypothetical protein